MEHGLLKDLMSFDFEAEKWQRAQNWILSTKMNKEIFLLKYYESNYYLSK